MLALQEQLMHWILIMSVAAAVVLSCAVCMVVIPACGSAGGGNYFASEVLFSVHICCSFVHQLSHAGGAAMVSLVLDV